ncbi:unnamed protein product [Caenorhabditis brenneri]
MFFLFLIFVVIFDEAQLQKLTVEENAQLQAQCGNSSLLLPHLNRRTMMEYCILNPQCSTRSYLYNQTYLTKIKLLDEKSKFSTLIKAVVISPRHLLATSNVLFSATSNYSSDLKYAGDSLFYIENMKNYTCELNNLVLDKKYHSRYSLDSDEERFREMKGFPSPFSKIIVVSGCIKWHYHIVFELNEAISFSDLLGPACVSFSPKSWSVENFTAFGDLYDGNITERVLYSPVECEMPPPVLCGQPFEGKIPFCGDEQIMAFAEVNGRDTYFGYNRRSSGCDTKEEKIDDFLNIGMFSNDLCEATGVCEIVTGKASTSHGETKTTHQVLSSTIETTTTSAKTSNTTLGPTPTSPVPTTKSSTSEGVEAGKVEEFHANKYQTIFQFFNFNFNN